MTARLQRTPRPTRPPRPMRLRQRGQAMIEYFVVLAFGVILLTRPTPQNECVVAKYCGGPPPTPYTCGTPPAPASVLSYYEPQTVGSQAPCPSPIDMLTNTIRDYHSHYSYAMAIAYVPNCEVPFNLSRTLSPSDISNAPTVLLQASGTIDPCIDPTNIRLPMPDFSNISMSFEGFGSSLLDQLGSYVVQQVETQAEEFLNPADLLSSFSFSISDFF
jgi:hypothetical protein